MEMYLFFVIPIVAVFIYFTVLYLIANKLNNYSIVDIGWGTGFVLIAIISFILSIIDRQGLPTITSFLMLITTSIWGLRLAYHILKRNHGRPEDYRYANMRINFEKKRYPKLAAFLKVFILQAVLMIFVATVLLVSMTAVEVANPVFRYTFIAIGLLVWIIGFIFESVGDAQLKRFIKNPANKGKIMDKGLWRYTRHPNYFGESVMWWGLAIMGVSVQYGWIGFLSPIIITYLLLFVSGVPLLEKAFKDNVEFQKYAVKTSIFIPWFPKKDQSRKE